MSVSEVMLAVASLIGVWLSWRLYVSACHMRIMVYRLNMLKNAAMASIEAACYRQDPASRVIEILRSALDNDAETERNS